MKSTSSLLFLSALTLALCANSHALVPTPKETAAQFEAARKDLESMSKEEVKNLFDAKNAKGESVYVPKSKIQSGINFNRHWSTFDPTKSDAQGTATDTVYAQYADKIAANKGGDIVVAVIDSGVDIEHEALQGRIWSNPGESGDGKENNGIDDDKNGYIDDVHGWNFLGGYDANGKPVNVGGATYELTREVVRLEKLASERELTAREEVYYERLLKKYDKDSAQKLRNFNNLNAIKSALEYLANLGLDITGDITKETVSKINAVSLEGQQAKELILELTSQIASFTFEMVMAEYSQYEADALYSYNKTFNFQSIIGDNSDDPSIDKSRYGNNDVEGPDASHGTHVAGIIAGIRGKNRVDGQATNVKIMSVRAVPDGDERDKDVANAIYYAARNGARVINMSFGKGYSPYKWYVDKAVRYAESKGVLLVHSAGNSGINTSDTKDPANGNYPNRNYLSGGRAANWLEVGASNVFKDPALFKDVSLEDLSEKARTLTAEFSNYGYSSVNLFAPGRFIYSSVPGNDYAVFNGTSMAGPNAAGVAALLLNLFPASTAQVFRAMITTTTQYDDVNVILPGTEEVVKPFSYLSTAGGIVNAYEAVKQLENVVGSY